MKLNITLLFICCMINTDVSFALAIVKPGEDKPGIAKVSNNIKASEFVKLSAKDFSIITGKKMNMWNRLSFSVLKLKIKHDLKKNPNLYVTDYYFKESDNRNFNWWVFGIGLIVALILAYLLLKPLAGL